MDDDSDRASETSSGSRSRKSNGKSKGKNKSSKKKIDLADEDSDTSQASGKNKKKAGKSKGKREKIVINKKGKKDRKKKAGELLSLSVIAFKCFVYKLLLMMFQFSTKVQTKKVPGATCFLSVSFYFQRVMSWTKRCPEIRWMQILISIPPFAKIPGLFVLDLPYRVILLI